MKGFAMDFEYSALEALAAVIQEGTFEAAAKALHITQSAVSQRIKLLEERAGAVLVIRGRPCTATEYGQHLCRHIEQVQLLEHELRKSLLTVANPTVAVPAVIRIAVNNDSLATWFPEVMQRAAAELNLLFDIFPDDQDYTAQRLRSGEALAVITTLERPLQGCRRVSLGAMDYIAICAPRFFHAHFSEGVTLAAVADAPHLAYDRKDTLPQQWVVRAFGQAIPLRGHRLPSYLGQLASCLNGAGWGLMPRATVEAALLDGRLVELMPGIATPLSLHWQSSVQSSEIMRLLAGIVMEVARKHLRADQFRDR